MNSDRLPRVSAIVVSFNRAADLRHSLQALIATGYPNLEIIVVDNASGDGSTEVAASFSQVRLVRSDANLGFAGGNNRGLTEATGEYLALVNDDAVVEPTWAGELVAFLEEHPEAAAAGGKAYIWDSGHPAGDRSGPYYSYTTIDPRTCLTQAFRDTPDEVREVATLSGCAVMVRRQAIQDVGPPFLEPEFFTYYEETDFFARAVGKGWRLFYAGRPAVWHRVGGSDLARRHRYFFYMQRNRVLFAYRNLGPAALAAFLRRDRQEARLALRRRARRLFLGRDDAFRAQREARRWAADSQALLDSHRASSDNARDDRYERAVDAIQSRAGYYGHDRPEVAALVPPTARRVVDVGCGSGALGRRLKASRPGIEVRGVEPEPEQARSAKAVLDDVLVGRAEDPLPAAWPRPDCLLFADVLEHLSDPWSVLRTYRAVLGSAGTVVLSVPNVAHRTVVGPLLLQGRWDYLPAGVMDRSHLRFFTRATAIEMLESAGFRVRHVERVLDMPDTNLLQGVLLRLARAHVRRERDSQAASPSGWASILRRVAADLCTVQFLIVAEPR